MTQFSASYFPYSSNFSIDVVVIDYLFRQLISRFQLITRCLRTLFLEESLITEHNGEWLHELATNNCVLENLNFYNTDLKNISLRDLELLASNCRSLVSLKINDSDISDLVGVFRAATVLEEFGGGSFNEQGEANRYERVTFPSRLCSLSLMFMGTNEMPTIFSLCAALKRLDLQFTFLSTEDHCQLIQRCPNLEILEVVSS